MSDTIENTSSLVFPDAEAMRSIFVDAPFAYVDELEGIVVQGPGVMGYEKGDITGGRTEFCRLNFTGTDEQAYALYQKFLTVPKVKVSL